MMNDTIMVGSWLFDFSEGWLIAAAILLLLVLPLTLVACWRRLFARNRWRAIWVIGLNLVAFFALLLLLVSPLREHTSSQNIILVSEGTGLSDQSPGAEDRIYEDGDYKNRVYIAPAAMQDQLERQAMINANWLLDVGQLQLREPALTSIDLRGFGLSKEQWQTIPEDVAVNFTAPPVFGFSAMRWPQTLVMGESVSIQGRFSSPESAGAIELRLLDPAGELVTGGRIRNGDSFNMLVRPKSQGNLLYRLQAWQQDTLISDQPVTVSVRTGGLQHIMVYQSAPSFETRQLKDFASSIGAKVLLNTAISRGKSVTQIINQTATVDKALSPASLAASDWLIIDGRALTGLADTQQRWLLEAVQTGLGVLVLADESLLKNFDQLSGSLLQAFLLQADTERDDEAIPQLMNVESAQNQLPLPVPNLKLEAAKPAQMPLDTIIADLDGRVLVAGQTIGTGKIAIGLISQSYRWLTAGHRTSWSNYWAAISTALSRNRQTAFLIPPADDEFYSENQRARVCAFARQQNLTVQIISNSKTMNAENDSEESISGIHELPLTADKLGSALQCGWFWPPAAGWQTIQLRQQDDSKVIDSQSRFVWGADQWRGQKRFIRSAATLDKLARTNELKAKASVGKLITEPLNPFWLWLMFIISASALWLERKLDWDAPRKR